MLTLRTRFGQKTKRKRSTSAELLSETFTQAIYISISFHRFGTAADTDDVNKGNRRRMSSS